MLRNSISDVYFWEQMAEYKLCYMVAVYHLKLQTITNFFWEINKLKAAGFGSADGYKPLCMMLNIFLLFYLF